MTGVTVMALPASVFQATAIVGVDEPSAALRLAAARAAAEFAVSKPVIARAASSLNGTVVSAPAPAFAEKLGVATGLAGATGAVARLADALAPIVSATAGDGLVEVRARAADAQRAARFATALAEALVAEEENSVVAAAGHRELTTTARIETLREAARAAHAQLAALGGSDTDPVDALANAAASIRTAEARLAAVHTVIAAGTPPLGAGSQLPSTAAALQQTYWDLKKQLDKATESMGERHTTVIALRDGVARATASLIAEWQRIERGAAGDVTVARSRESVLRKTATVADPVKRAALDEARGVARLADAALARATAAPAVAAFANPPFRLVAAAGVPASAAGLDALQRGAIGGGAGIGAFALAWLLARRRERPANPIRRADAVATPDETSANADAEPARVNASAPANETKAEPAEPRRAAAPVLAERRIPAAPLAEVAERPAASLDHQPGYDFFASEWPKFEADTVADDRIAAMPFESASFDADPSRERGHAVSRAIDPDLRDALRAIAADLAGLASGRMATMMVAANAAGADTGAVALAVGEAAAELGYRVLVIEGECARSTLAEAVSPDGDPLIVDAFGALRVALPAERLDGLFLAPALRDGARIAAALARNTQADLIDDLAAIFDAVVIDGGRAADSAAAGWTADAFIRVGRFASHKDDAYLLDAFDAPPEALLGTVAAGRFVARETVPEPRAAVRPSLRAVPASLDVAPPRRPATVPSSPLRVPPRRRVSAR